MLAAPAIITDAGAIAGALTGIGIFFAGLWQVVKRTITTTVRPMVDDVRAASKSQHDEQNVVIERGFQAVHHRLDALETRREAQTRSHGIVEAVHEAAQPATEN